MKNFLFSLFFISILGSLNAQLGTVNLISPSPVPQPLLSGVTYTFIFEYEYLPGTSLNVVDPTTVMPTALTGSAMFGTPVLVGSFVSLAVTPTSGDLTLSVSMDDNDPSSIASIGTYISSPLTVPVEFGEIKYEERNNDISISWTTYSELNSDFFELERSYDGTNFEVVERILAAGNSADLLSYSINDSELDSEKNKLFYRIKQVDIDGQLFYSDVLTISKEHSGPSLRLENTNIDGDLNLKISSSLDQEVAFQLFSLSGQIISQGTVSVTKGQNFVRLERPSTTGMAVITLNDGKDLVSKKIMM